MLKYFNFYPYSNLFYYFIKHVNVWNKNFDCSLSDGFTQLQTGRKLLLDGWYLSLSGGWKQPEIRQMSDIKKVF